jgi:TrmH family RNA methyltransferase
MGTAGKTTSARDPGAPSTLITSRENRWLKDFRLALRGGLATASGCVGVEGLRLVEEALRSDLAVEAVLASVSGERHLERLAAPLARLDRASLRILRTTDRLFGGIADTESPQGIAALVRVRTASFDDLVRPSSGSAPFLAILAGVQDPGNVGTILRTAEAFGATGAATCASSVSGTANPFSPKGMRASAGATLRLPILHGVGLPVLLAQLRVSGIKTFAAVAHDVPARSAAAASFPASSGLSTSPVLSPWEADWGQPAAILIGNEGAGLPEDLQRSADARIRVPIAAGIESLNVAIAAALIFYEASRQRFSGAAPIGCGTAARGVP